MNNVKEFKNIYIFCCKVKMENSVYYSGDIYDEGIYLYR